MKIEIIVIGDELLIGQVTDTNSAWIASELNHIGWEISRITTVSDNADAITDAIDGAFARTDTILMTGGLGPTSDDITKPVLCRYFGGKMVFDENVYKHVQQIFAQRGLQMNESTRHQADVPDVCTVITNKVGTAPIMWFEKNNKILVSMPGVPHEMRVAMKGEVIPRLRQHYHDHDAIIHRTLLVYNNTESGLSERLQDFERNLPHAIRLAYLPTPGMVRLRLTARGDNENVLATLIDNRVEQLQKILGSDIFATDDQAIAQVLGHRLTECNLTISTAESCTGGNVAHEITSIPGSSQYFKGSVVAYANEIKQHLLNVPATTLQEYGAVSRQTVEYMVQGVQQLMGTSCAIATSGIAGPDGGTPDKPVGTVWIAVRCGNTTVTACPRFNGSRHYVIEQATQRALLMLIKLINDLH